ncbi:MAG: monovalent cation/H+ antiporter complex subunit F [Burkholderiales bacterium]
MLTAALSVTTAMLSLALLPILWRLVRGPDTSDRLLALDTLSLTLAGLLIVLGIATASPLMVEAALVIAAFGCVGTIALARSAQRAAPGD